MSLQQLKVVMNLSKLTDDGKLNKSSMVIDNINNNANSFPSAVPLVAAATAALAAARAAVTLAQDGSKQQKAQKADAMRGLLAEMNAIGAAVEHDAKGDPGIVHLAGLDVKTYTHPAAVDFSVKLGGETGKVLIAVAPHKGAAYLWEYSADPAGASGWTEAASGTTSRVEIGGLTPGLKYWFRYAFIDRQGRHPYSSPLSVIVV